MIESIASLQKFIATIGCGGVCSVLVYAGKISDDIFGMIIIATVGGFITGEVIQKVKQANAEAKANADQTIL